MPVTIDNLGRIKQIASQGGINSGSVSQFALAANAVTSGAVASGATWQNRPLAVSGLTYYVSTLGSDSNFGITSGSPFLTIQKAVNTASSFDLNGNSITIQCMSGTYSGATLQTFGGAGSINIYGWSSGTPTQTTITNGDANATVIFGNGVVGLYSVNNLAMTLGKSGGACINAINAQINISNLVFGSGGGLASKFDGIHLQTGQGGFILVTGPYQITGGLPCHILQYAGYVQCLSQTITLSNTPFFTGQFINSNGLAGAQMASNTYTGAGAGQRYSIIGNSVCNTAGGGATYFPGSSGGTTGTGGQYL